MYVRLATEMVKKGQSETKKIREITFKCKFCGNTKLVDEIRVLTRFCPPSGVCLDCEKKLG